MSELDRNDSDTPTLIGLQSVKVGSILGGRYKLLEQIGEGGMGSVWVAEQQQPVKRRVAVKLIKAGMDSRQVLSRFEAERQALAMMDHPNIAKALDGGVSESGHPYFVMEYVKGISLTQYCDDAKLTLNERLELFISVCHAVQHAHHKGIIHRDLKPSNILVCLYDGKPVPKVIDFGLAKALHQSLTEHTLYTAHGMMVGTPLYMSPEQAEHNNLDIDTRTDVYSLGVILYELLTGTTPLERQSLNQAAYDQMLKMIKELEPPRPSLRLSGSDSLPSIAAQRRLDPQQLRKSLTGDLDWIVMKALEKERSRRYETATGLAKDIERYLREEPVEACPPTVGYRFSKLVRRYRKEFAAVSVLAVTMVLGIIGTSVGYIRAESLRRAENLQREAAEKATATALAEKALAEDATRRALASENSARRASDQAIKSDTQSKAVIDFFQKHILLAARPVPEGGLGVEITLLNAIKSSLPQIEKEFAGLPETEARIRYSLGRTLSSLGDRESAVRELKRSVELCEQSIGSTDSLTLGAKESLAFALFCVGKTEESHQLNMELLDYFRKQPSNEAKLLHLTENEANYLSRKGETAEAIDLYQKAYDASRKVHGSDSVHTLNLACNLAGCFWTIGKKADAITLIEKTAAIATTSLGPANAKTLWFVMQEARLKSASEQHVQALEILTPAYEILVREFGPNHQDTLYCEGLIASCHAQLGHFNEAIDLYEASLPKHRSVLGDNHEWTPPLLNSFLDTLDSAANQDLKMNETQKAREKFQRALDLAVKFAEQQDSLSDIQYTVVRRQFALANCLTTIGELDAATSLYDSSSGIIRRFVEAFPEEASYRTTWGVTFRARGDILLMKPDQAKEALAAYEEAAQVFAVAPDGPSRPAELSRAISGRALALSRLGKHADAVEAWDQYGLYATDDSSKIFFRLNRFESLIRLNREDEDIPGFESLHQRFEMEPDYAALWAGQSLYQMAYLYSLLSAKIPNRQEELASRAVLYLNRAAAAGYRDSASIEHMKTDPDLDPLRMREDFQAFIQGLSKPKASTPISPPSPAEARAIE